jgi:hypothetical protein
MKDCYGELTTDIDRLKEVALYTSRPSILTCWCYASSAPACASYPDGKGSCILHHQDIQPKDCCLSITRCGCCPCSYSVFRSFRAISRCVSSCSSDGQNRRPSYLCSKDMAILHVEDLGLGSTSLSRGRYARRKTMSSPWGIRRSFPDADDQPSVFEMSTSSKGRRGCRSSLDKLVLTR